MNEIQGLGSNFDVDFDFEVGFGRCETDEFQIRESCSIRKRDSDGFRSFRFQSLGLKNFESQESDIKIEIIIKF